MAAEGSALNGTRMRHVSWVALFQRFLVLLLRSAGKPGISLLMAMAEAQESKQKHVISAEV